MDILGGTYLKLNGLFGLLLIICKIVYRVTILLRAIGVLMLILHITMGISPTKLQD